MVQKQHVVRLLLQQDDSFLEVVHEESVAASFDLCSDKGEALLREDAVDHQICKSHRDHHAHCRRDNLHVESLTIVDCPKDWGQDLAD